MEVILDVLEVILDVMEVILDVMEVILDVSEPATRPVQKAVSRSRDPSGLGTVWQVHLRPECVEQTYVCPVLGHFPEPSLSEALRGLSSVELIT